MTDLTWVIGGWFVGGFINGVAGFGAAMVAMPIIAPFIDFSVAVPSCALIVLTLSCQVGWTFKRYIQWRYIRGILMGAVPGVLLSIPVLANVSETNLKATMGAFIACYAFWSLCTDNGEIRAIHNAWGYLAGVLSSALGMAFGFNGPPLAAYIAYSGCPAKAVKGVLSAGFIITGICIVSAKAIGGQINSVVLLTYAAATPAAILGSKLGIWLSSSLNEASYRKILFIALAAMGLRIMWTALS